MRRLFIILASIGFLGLLSGCASSNDNEDKEDNVTEYFSISKTNDVDFQKAENIEIIKDTSTGCEYAIINPSSGNAKMFPYYDEKGNVSGCKQSK